MVPGSTYLPSFAFSIGLVHTYNHPEIICFGLKTDLLHVQFNDVAAIIKRYERMEVGRPYSGIKLRQYGGANQTARASNSWAMVSGWGA
jgi:hypothetical protein